jgi:hypothetical protein
VERKYADAQREPAGLLPCRWRGVPFKSWRRTSSHSSLSQLMQARYVLVHHDSIDARRREHAAASTGQSTVVTYCTSTRPITCMSSGLWTTYLDSPSQTAIPYSHLTQPFDPTFNTSSRAAQVAVTESTIHDRASFLPSDAGRVRTTPCVDLPRIRTDEILPPYPLHCLHRRHHLHHPLCRPILRPPSSRGPGRTTLALATCSTCTRSAALVCASKGCACLLGKGWRPGPGGFPRIQVFVQRIKTSISLVLYKYSTRSLCNAFTLS